MRPPRYYDQEFMTKRWSHYRGFTVYVYFEKRLWNQLESLLVGYDFWVALYLNITPIRILTNRVPNKFFGLRDFLYLRLGIRDFKAKPGEDSGLKVFTGGGIPQIIQKNLENSNSRGSNQLPFRLNFTPLFSHLYSFNWYSSLTRTKFPLPWSKFH